jgi:hypothetical protein
LSCEDGRGSVSSAKPTTPTAIVNIIVANHLLRNAADEEPLLTSPAIAQHETHALLSLTAITRRPIAHALGVHAQCQSAF